MNRRPCVPEFISGSKDALEMFRHFRSVVICPANLDRAWHARSNCGDDCAQNVNRLTRMGQEMSAAIVRADFFDRTREIDIDHIMPHRDDDVGGARHLIRLRPHDLAGERMIIERGDDIVRDFAHPAFRGDEIWIFSNLALAAIEQGAVEQCLGHTEWTTVSTGN